MLGVRACL